MKVGAELDCQRDSRKEKRLQVRIGAGLRRRGEKGSAVQVLDLSTRGFLVEANDGLSAGVNVWLKLPGIETMFARVAWCKGRRFGCEFTRPLHPRVVDRVAALSSEAASQ
jgi:hypothetical protein